MQTPTPPLTEQWATTYLQILFNVLLVVLGIPFLLWQQTREDVRHILAKRQFKARLWVFVVLVLFALIYCFVLIFYPAALNVPSVPGLRRVADYARGWHGYFPLLLLTFSLLAIVFSYAQGLRYTRASLIAHLRKRLIKAFRKKGVLPPGLVSDLTYLGEHGQPGDEKGLVLAVLADVTEAVQERKGRGYTGRELEEVIRGLGTVLRGRGQTGSDENYKDAAKLLKSIWSNVPAEISSHDAMLAASTLKQLGFDVIREKSEEAAFIYIKHAAAWDSAVVFELGLKALEVRRVRIAIEALNKLETLAQAANRGALWPTETVGNLLGLLAHFSAYGASARNRAGDFLSANRGHFRPSLRRCTEAAIYGHYMAGNFDTADALFEMLEPAAADGPRPAAPPG